MGTDATGRVISDDLRERAVAAYLEGGSCRSVAARFGVGEASVVRYGQPFRATGSVSLKPMGASHGSALDLHRNWLLARIAEHPSIILEGLRRERAAPGARVGYGTVWRFVEREKLSFKKSVRTAGQDRPDVAAARTRWREEQPAFDPAHLVFIDETWAKTNMAPLRGRGRRGKRLIGKVPFGRWTTTTFVAALRRDGVTAPFVIEGAINGPSFRAYVTQCLAPTLRSGDIVVMDNFGSHKSSQVRAAIEARAATLRYPPASSPDLNPIEMMFSKLEALLRRAEGRTVLALWDRIGSSLDLVSPNEFANYFKAAGYASA